jgi:hypothetical protein
MRPSVLVTAVVGFGETVVSTKLSTLNDEPLAIGGP